MKKAFKFSAIISMLAILVCFVALMAPQVYAAEAGTTVSNPIILTEDTYYSKYWTEDNYDLNCYSKIEVPARGYITITIEKPVDSEGEICSFNISLFNPDGEIVWGADSGDMISSFSDTYVYKVGLNAGTYYMNLDPNFFVWSGSIPSQFKYSFTAASDWEIEPNGEIVNAMPIELNTMYNAVYCEESYDTIYKDIYAVQLEAGKKYDIRIDNYVKVESGTLINRIINTNGEEESFPYDYKQEGSVCIFNYDVQTSGTYYIVFDNDGNTIPFEYKVGVYEFVCKHTPAFLKEASCTTKAICANCGEEYGELDPTYHSHLGPLLAVEATCTETGLTLGYKCFDCGVVKTPQEVVPAKGHTVEVVPGFAAGCTTTGRTSYKTCSVCNEYITNYEIIPATGHKIVAMPAKAATYTATGLTAGKKCSECGTVTVKQKKVAKKKLKKVTISSVKSTKSKQATVNWKKVTDTTGYIVEYSTSKKFTKKTTKKVTIKKAKTLKTTLKKLKSGKKYYIRIRAYKTVGKKTVYGAYRSVKTVKVK